MRVGEKVIKIIKNKFQIPKFIKQNKLKITFGIVSVFTIIVLILCIIPGNNIVKTMGKSFLEGLGIYTEEIKSVQIESDDFDDPGSWRIEKSARWTSSDTAQIIFDLKSMLKKGTNNVDVILVLDTSASMSGEKISRVKSDSKELIEFILSDTQNKVAIISFGDNSNVVSNFSNNKSRLLNEIGDLLVGGSTNYNAALLNVESIMNGYTKQPNREVVTLFLTDGYPDVDTPNQIGTYEMIKDKYSYMMIQGIQYEMGLDDVVDEIKNISDNQWIADKDTLNNILFEASMSSVKYDKFIITDYINDDYFTINSVNDINVSIGSVSLEEESGVSKVVWNLGEGKYLTGGKPRMKISVKLKSQYVGQDGYYPTNKKTNVVYKLHGNNESGENTTSTPVLKNLYKVIYDTNTPDGCSLPSVAAENHYVYQTVSKRTNKLSCAGYEFKGWQIDGDDNNDIKMINDDVFVMPSHNVTIRGTWTKQMVTKSMDGTVHEKTTLYKVLKNEAEIGTYASEYKKEHQDSINPSLSTQKIYAYSSDTSLKNEVLNKSNVLFGEMCWRMYRTTDTGGVKLIYNGQPINNQCLDTRESQIGYNSIVSSAMNYNYWYGTDYTYDSITGEFSLTGIKEQTTWSDSTASGLLDKYTCKSTNEYATCTTLYLVESYKSSTEAKLIKLDSNSDYYSFGKLRYNDGKRATTRSGGAAIYDAGYMYEDERDYIMSDIPYLEPLYTSSASMITRTGSYDAVDWWYADSYSYDSVSDKYTLINPYQVATRDDVGSTIGKYASTGTAPTSRLYYIVGFDPTKYSYNVGYLQLVWGRIPSDYNVILSDSYTANNNGTYSLDNPITVTPEDWFLNYENYNYKYVCNKNVFYYTNSTCSRIEVISNTSQTSLSSYALVENNNINKIMIGKGHNGYTLTDTILIPYDDFIENRNTTYSDYKYTCFTDSASCTADTIVRFTGYSGASLNTFHNYNIGSRITWDGTKYTLSDTINIMDLDDYTEEGMISTLNTRPYICLDDYNTLTCTKVGKTISYREYSPEGGVSGFETLQFIELRDGELTHSDALKNIFEKNEKSSVAKKGVDAWYKHFMLPYDEYIEDTIYCNNRKIVGLEFFNDTVQNGLTSKRINYNTLYSSVKELYCPNETDRFSINNSKAQLTYKVGLLTIDELRLSVASRLPTGSQMLTISPDYSSLLYVTYIYSNAYSNDSSYTDLALRPVISLRPGIEYSDGDGSMEHPYIIDTNS